MSKVTMPGPLMYGIMGPDDEPYFGELCVSGDKGDLAAEIFGLNEGNGAAPYKEVALITTTKAEAHADARVRQALEEAARIADQWTTPEQRKFGAGGPAAAIRALIPPTK